LTNYDYISWLIFPMRKPKVRIFNVGDVWDNRVTDAASLKVIGPVAGRGVARPLDVTGRVVIPETNNRDHLDHVAQFLFPGNLAAQIAFVGERVRRVTLPVGDTATADYKAVLGRGTYEGFELDPYVDKESAAELAEHIGAYYDFENRCNPIVYALKDKWQFQEFLLRAGVNHVPYSRVGGREQDEHLDRCKDVVAVIEDVIQESGRNKLMIRQTVAGGGIGNAVVEKKPAGNYIVKVEGCDEGKDIGINLLNWLVETFNPKTNEAGILVAPYYSGTSISSTIEIRGGRATIPYVAKEMLNEAGTGFQGAIIDPDDLDAGIVEKAEFVLMKMANELIDQGVDSVDVQVDMRYARDTDEVYPVESNAMRRTATKDMADIVAGAVHEGHAKGFAGVDHLRVSPVIADRLAKPGAFPHVLKRTLNVSRALVEQALGVDRARAILNGSDGVDLNDFAVSPIAPHELNGTRMGLIISQSPMRVVQNPANLGVVVQMTVGERFEVAKVAFAA
jgi:hypothetical protein